MLFLAKFGAAKTLFTLAISYGIYAWLQGPWVAAGLVLMILIHEMGHVLEIRRQGLQASAPLFIPLFGAAIFQRQLPIDALRQAQIGIAGPLAGTVGATVAFALYPVIHSEILLLWAVIGFGLNLFNLIPVGMLDGGWIMAVVSKWFQVVGLVLMVGAVLLLHVNPIFVVLILLWMVPSIIDRFRNDRLPYYQAVPAQARLAMGGAWLFLAAFLVFALLQTVSLLAPYVR